MCRHRVLCGGGVVGRGGSATVHEVRGHCVGGADAACPCAAYSPLALKTWVDTHHTADEFAAECRAMWCGVVETTRGGGMRWMYGGRACGHMVRYGVVWMTSQSGG